jgi:hypothetical protein
MSKFRVNDNTAQRMTNLVLSIVRPQEAVDQSKEEEEMQQQRKVRDAANFIARLREEFGAVKHMPCPLQI